MGAGEIPQPTVAASPGVGVLVPVGVRVGVLDGVLVRVRVLDGVGVTVRVGVGTRVGSGTQLSMCFLQAGSRATKKMRTARKGSNDIPWVMPASWLCQQ